ncbi:MAG: hypothetical protein ABIV50_15435 [Opitutus sp.]
MNLLFFRIGAVLTVSAIACGAAETTKPAEKDASESRAKEYRTVPTPKADTVRVDQGTVVGNETPKAQPTPPLSPAAERERLRKEQAAAADAAVQDEKTRAADQVSALARGEGERYARRLRAYEAARAASARSSNEVGTKPTSIAEMQLADGRVVVVAGSDRKVFSNKSEADAFVADVRKADFDRPIVLTPTK